MLLIDKKACNKKNTIGTRCFNPLNCVTNRYKKLVIKNIIYGQDVSIHPRKNRELLGHPIKDYLKMLLS